MRNRDYSKWLKFVLVVLGVTASVLKWYGVLGNASIDEIWKVVGFAYGVGLGTMDLNIIHDSWVEAKATGGDDGKREEG